MEKVFFSLLTLFITAAYDAHPERIPYIPRLLRGRKESGSGGTGRGILGAEVVDRTVTVPYSESVFPTQGRAGFTRRVSLY